MTGSWAFRNKILDFTHRWPLALLFCFAGILLGWGISLLWPSTYRSSKELYVGIDPYRALTDRNASEHAGVEFANPDDYKNWQMADLNAFVHTDSVINATLKRLRQQDEIWHNVDRETLAGILKANWRNAGKWRLVAEHESPDYAAQAVSTWYDVVLEHVRTAILNSQETYELDTQLQSIGENQIQIALRLAEFVQFHSLTVEKIASISALPANTSIDQQENGEMRHLAAKVNHNGVWISSLEEFPSQGSPTEDYLHWLQRVETALNQEIRVLENQIDALEKRRGTIADQYAQASQKSYGLSANLQVEALRAAPTEHYAVRPTGLLVLAGGILGFLLWALLWLVDIAMKAPL